LERLHIYRYLQRSDYKDYITARTNLEGVQFIKDLFPNKIVKEFDLVKSKLEARDNALHLDCCFQPVGMIRLLFIKWREKRL
jgi:N-dimethylarginine dimethylaminohydrolase